MRLTIEMKVSIMQKLWSSVEKTQANMILSLSDRDLKDLLVSKVKGYSYLTREDNNDLANYIEAKSTLIRDLAEFRLA